MIKTAFSIALVGLVSAQSLASLQPLANQAVAAAQPVLSNNNIALTQGPDSTSLAYGENEWDVNEYNNEDAFNSNADSLAPTLSVLLGNVGNIAGQDTNNAQNALVNEAQSVGVNMPNSSDVAPAISSYSQQLQDSANAIPSAAQNAVGTVAVNAIPSAQNAAGNIVVNNVPSAAQNAVASNTGSIGNTVNNQFSSSTTISNTFNSASNNLRSFSTSTNIISNSGSPAQVQIQTTASPLNNAATNAANNINANQAASNFNNIASQGANMRNIAGSLPNGL